MLLKFTTSQICFSLYGVFGQIGQTGSETKFKAQIISLLEAHSEPTDEHDVEVSKDILLKCYSNVALSPYGVTTDIASDLLASLKTQLIALGTEEAVDTLTAIAELKVKDGEYAAARIEACKEQILS